MLTMPEDQAFVCHKDAKSALEGEIKDGCLTLKYTEFGPDRDSDYWKSYLFSAEQTAKLFGALRLQSFINLCIRSGEDGLMRFLKNHGIEYTVRDWLDEWTEGLPEEEQKELDDPTPATTGTTRTAACTACAAGRTNTALPRTTGYGARPRPAS